MNRRRILVAAVTVTGTAAALVAGYAARGATGLIDVAGLEVEALYGGFAGEPFTDDSREYVFVTRRPR